jgi:hypothetical protein
MPIFYFSVTCYLFSHLILQYFFLKMNKYRRKNCNLVIIKPAVVPLSIYSPLCTFSSWGGTLASCAKYISCASSADVNNCRCGFWEQTFRIHAHACPAHIPTPISLCVLNFQKLERFLWSSSTSTSSGIFRLPSQKKITSILKHNSSAVSTGCYLQGRLQYITKIMPLRS